MRRILTVLVVVFSVFIADLHLASAAPSITMWFPNPWKNKTAQVQKIAVELGKASGLTIVPRIAGNYPELLTALIKPEPQIAYVGSMVASVIWSRRLAQPLFQAVDGKHLYAGVMLFTKGRSPGEILKNTPGDIAYNIGATSGEVCAKVASGGKASQGVLTHGAAADAVKTGKAQAAFVKDFWWDDNKSKYPELDVYLVPGVSESKNPDNLMLVSTSVAPEVRGLVLDAAYHNPQLFGANFIFPFDSSSLDYTLLLMKQAGIDPLTYSWPQ